MPMKPIRIALICFAAVSASLLLFFELGFVLHFFLAERDPLDRAQVVSVQPSPNGESAAVLYTYGHANSSATTVWLAVAQKPFPEIGADYYSKEPVAGVYSIGVGWPSPDLDPAAMRAIHFKWADGSTLDVCPGAGVKLVYFATRGFAGVIGRYTFAHEQIVGQDVEIQFCGGDVAAAGWNERR
jgi:hypothetical protein